MKSLTFLLIIPSLTIACSPPPSPPSPSSQVSSQESTSKTAVLTEKAEKVCGDRLPEDPASYPVNFYSVSVEYSADNLAKIKNHFCEDALPKTSESLGREVVQVASFISKEKADLFKVKLSQYFGQVTIGEPTIIEKPKTEVRDRKSDDGSLDTVESIAKAALLNSEQTQQLLDLENSRMFSSNEGNKFEIGKVKVIVPTFVPSRFSLHEVSRISAMPRSRHETRYSLRYKSSTGETFDVTNFELIGDGPLFRCDVGRLEHPLLGKINLWYSGSDTVGKDAELSFRIPYTLDYRGQPTGYYFYSGEKNGLGKMIPREEAIKIVNSLKALNPNTQFDSIPSRSGGWPSTFSTFNPSEKECGKK